jgi:hypothetical protein
VQRSESVPQQTGVTQRGALPLLIQGLLEQLPKDGRWTHARADQWLKMARMSFEIVYEMDDAETPSDDVLSDLEARVSDG